jgi:hypothetical protein
MLYGMPRPGDVDRRPSARSQPWSSNDVELYRATVLWLALREYVPNTGQRVEDIFIGKALLVKFTGSKEQILADTLHELKGGSFEGR